MCHTTPATRPGRSSKTPPPLPARQPPKVKQQKKGHKLPRWIRAWWIMARRREEYSPCCSNLKSSIESNGVADLPRQGARHEQV